ncbi:hypothetical protein [Geminocystis herdmanii]|nr:hypothetical protein [Geminocystis herdmanii]
MINNLSQMGLLDRKTALLDRGKIERTYYEKTLRLCVFARDKIY